MTTLPILAFFGGIGATFIVLPLWSSIVWKKKKECEKEQGKLLMDLSALLDARLLDFASSGLLDKRLLLPHFILKKLYQEALSEDEVERLKAKKGLEQFRRLETLPGLDLKIIEELPPKRGDTSLEMMLLARLLQANLLTSDPQLQESISSDGIRVVNLHPLTQAFKSPILGGDLLFVKILRVGKEVGQGVGYLEDGTMVVVNGASHLVGEQVESIVLSIKHNTAGRMVFCNTREEQMKQNDYPLEKKRLLVTRLGSQSHE